MKPEQSHQTRLGPAGPDTARIAQGLVSTCKLSDPKLVIPVHGP